MPWKERYTISDEKSLADDEIRWPQGARCCVGITVDLSVAAGPDGIRAADLTTPEAEFGANQGLGALLAVRATFAVPAVLAKIHAEQIRALAAEGHVMPSRPGEFHPEHRVTGGGHPPPVPTERGVRISRTNALRQLLYSTASACSSR